MYIFIGVLLSSITMIYCNKKILSIKLSDFEEEDRRLQEEGMVLIKVECEEIRKDRGIKSDNYLAMMISIVISFIFIFIKENSTYTAFFTPVIPILITLFFIDIRMKRIPTSLINPIFIFGLINLITVVLLTNNINLIFSNIINSTILLVIYFFIAIVTGGMLGGGDIKLISAVALFYQLVFLNKFLLYPFLIGGIQAVYLLLFKNKKGNDMFAFAPAIIIGVLIIAIS